MASPVAPNTANPSQNPGYYNSNSGSGDTSSNTNRTQQQGTGFTNINQILDANQGAGQAEGNKIQSGLTNQADSVRAGIQASQNQFNTSSSQNAAQANSAINAGTNLTQQAGESSDQYAARLAGDTTDNFSQIGTNLNNAAYTGPTGLANANQLESQGTTASQLGQLAGTGQGEQQLLANFVASPGNYTQGDASLDQLLLGNGGQNAVQQGAYATSGLGTTTANAANAATNQATALASGINTDKTNALAALQNSLTGNGTSTSNNITGLETLGSQQAQTFDTNATRLQQLISGTATNADGTPVNQSNMTPADQALLNSASNYGLNPTESFYTGNQAATTTALNALAQSMVLPNGGSGGYDYTANQQQAAEDLANTLGQQTVEQSIANNQFNTDAFSANPALLNAQSTAQQNALNILSGQQANLTAANTALNGSGGPLGSNGSPTSGIGNLNAELASLANVPSASQQASNLQGFWNNNEQNAVTDALTNSQVQQLNNNLPGGWSGNGNQNLYQWLKEAQGDIQQNQASAQNAVTAGNEQYNGSNTDLINAILQNLSGQAGGFTINPAQQLGTQGT